MPRNMEVARLGDLSQHEGAVAFLLWRGKNFPAAGHRGGINIPEPYMPDKSLKGMPEAVVKAAQHKDRGLIRQRKIARIEKDGR